MLDTVYSVLLCIAIPLNILCIVLIIRRMLNKREK